MPVDFRHINSPMQLKVIEKMEFANYTRFRKSSTHAYWAAKNLRKRLPYNPSQLGLVQWDNHTEISLFNMKSTSSCPIRQTEDFWIEADCLDVYVCLTRDTWQQVLDFLKTFDLTVEKLNISQISQPGSDFFYVGADFFISFIEICKVKSFYSKGIVDELVFASEEGQKLETINCRTPLNDECFLNLKATSLVILSSAITSKGINSLLKMWYSGERLLKQVEIWSNAPFHMEVFEDLKEHITQVPETEDFIYSYVISNGKEKLKVSLQNSYKITMVVIE